MKEYGLSSEMLDSLHNTNIQSTVADITPYRNTTCTVRRQN